MFGILALNIATWVVAGVIAAAGTGACIYISATAED